MDSKEEIKAKLPIYDLVSNYVELKKSGRNFKGLCPFHEEKTPSFMVSPEKDIAYCFGCHKGGDIFAFYQLVEGVEFVDAINVLAERTGVQLEKADPKNSAEQKSKKANLIEIHELVTDFYHKNLYESDEGKKVLEYLYNRGLKDETIKKYRLGFSYDSYDKTYKYILKNGFSKADLVESGIALSKDTDIDSLYDRFRLRLMFPICNKNGEVIAFGGRALKKDEPAKYLNSPETPIYHKSEALFGFFNAKDSIRKAREVIVVEGYFDQIMCFQAGFENTVAVSGTALTQRHISFLNRYADTVLFAFDSDTAGREALLRSAELAFASDMQVKVIDLGGQKDPADLIKNEPDTFRLAIENPKEFFDFILEKELFSLPLDQQLSLENVSRFLEKILPVADKIDSSVKKDIVLRKLSQALQTKIDFLYDELNSLKKFASPKSINTDQDFSKKFEFTPEDYFWCHILMHPSSYRNFSEELKAKPFLINRNQVYKSIDDYYNTATDFSDLSLKDLDISKDLSDKYNFLLLYLESVYAADWDAERVDEELAALMSRMLQSYKKEEGKRLQRMIVETEKSRNSEDLKKLLENYNKILSL